MNLLTQEELYIIPEVQIQKEDSIENYNFLMDFIPDYTESIPLLHFAYHSLKNYPNLELKLDIQCSKDEFVINSYFFILERTEYYRDENLTPNISCELARQDLLNIYELYNEPSVFDST